MRGYTINHTFAMREDVIRHCELIEIDVGTGGALGEPTTLRFAACGWDITHGGNIYPGTCLGVEFPKEDLTLAANPCLVYLAGNNAVMTALALSVPMANQPLRVYHALFNESYQAIAPMPLEFSGRVSHIDLNNVGNQDG